MDIWVVSKLLLLWTALSRPGFAPCEDVAEHPEVALLVRAGWCQVTLREGLARPHPGQLGTGAQPYSVLAAGLDSPRRRWFGGWFRDAPTRKLSVLACEKPLALMRSRPGRRLCTSFARFPAASSPGV